MTDKIVISALLSILFAAPCAAGQNKSIPTVEGKMVANDPYVEEFDLAMKTAIADMIAVRSAIQAVPIPPMTRTGAYAAMGKAAAEFAATASIMAKAEAAHAKFIAHLTGFEADELDIKLKMKGPAFDQKNDANVRPKADKIMQGNFATASAGNGGGVSRVAAPAAASPKFAPVSSPFSYGANGGTQFGLGFESSLGGGTQGGGAGMITAEGQSAAGGGVATGAADRAASAATSTGTPDAKPSANPAELTKNTSNVAQLAAQRMKERQEAAEQAAEQRRQEAKQRKQQQQQMMMQAGMMAAQMGAQLAQTVAQNAEKQGEGQAAANAAPPLS